MMITTLVCPRTIFLRCLFLLCPSAMRTNHCKPFNENPIFYPCPVMPTQCSWAAYRRWYADT
jgi:hypothetical protein